MNNPSQIELIDINTEAKHITQLFNTYFKHTSSDEEVINLVLKINNFVEENYAHILLSGTYKSGLSNVLHEQTDMLMNMFERNGNIKDFISSKESIFLRNLMFKKKDIAQHSNYDVILKHLRKELKEDLQILKKFKIKQDQSEVKYLGFDSSAATHEGIETALSKEYTEYTLERHGGTVHGHIIENLLTHLLELHTMNNDIKIREQIREYFDHQERDTNTGMIIKEDESLLKEPIFKYMNALEDKTVNKEKLLKDYIKKEGVFKVDIKESKRLKM